MRHAMKSAATAAVLTVLAPHVHAGGGVVADFAERALARGHGATCSLDYRPVATGGYWPCLDFGPYRYVSAYGKVHGFVVREGHEPLMVLTGPPGRPDFIHDGPWKEDMPARLVMWWNETVEGRIPDAARATESSERRAAAEYILSLRGETAAEPVQPDAPQQADAPRQPASPVGLPGTSSGEAEDMSDDVRQLLSTYR